MINSAHWSVVFFRVMINYYLHHQSIQAIRKTCGDRMKCWMELHCITQTSASLNHPVIQTWASQWRLLLGLSCLLHLTNLVTTHHTSESISPHFIFFNSLVVWELISSIMSVFTTLGIYVWRLYSVSRLHSVSMSRLRWVSVSRLHSLSMSRLHWML